MTTQSHMMPVDVFMRRHFSSPHAEARDTYWSEAFERERRAEAFDRRETARNREAMKRAKAEGRAPE